MQYYGDYFWYLENDEGSITIGITDEGLEETGDVRQIVLAETEEELSADEGCGTIRGRDSYMEIPAPMDLRIIERNEFLLENPELVHEDPTGESWLLKVEEV
jgi:glycine cleavage system H protein